MSAQVLQERQLGGILTDIFGAPTISAAQTQSTTVRISSKSSTSTASSSTSTATTSSSSSPSPSFFTSTSTSSSLPAVGTTVAAQTIITLTASAGGQTSTIGPTPTPTPARPPTAAAFLQNKALSGVVFGIAGLVGLAIFISIAIFVIRRRRNKKLLEEAVLFDPVSVGGFDDKPSPTGHETDALPFAQYNFRPYPYTSYMYPTTAPYSGASRFQSPPVWSTPVQQHIGY